MKLLLLLLSLGLGLACAQGDSGEAPAQPDFQSEKVCACPQGQPRGHPMFPVAFLGPALDALCTPSSLGTTALPRPPHQVSPAG